LRRVARELSRSLAGVIENALRREPVTYEKVAAAAFGNLAVNVAGSVAAFGSYHDDIVNIGRAVIDLPSPFPMGALKLQQW
jgi:hypothetical protein